MITVVCFKNQLSKLNFFPRYASKIFNAYFGDIFSCVNLHLDRAIFSLKSPNIIGFSGYSSENVSSDHNAYIGTESSFVSEQPVVIFVLPVYFASLNLQHTCFLQISNFLAITEFHQFIFTLVFYYMF